MKNPVVTIREFSKHLDKSVEELLVLTNTTGHEDHLDLIMEVNGKTVKLDLNTDTYVALDEFLIELMNNISDEYDGDALWTISKYQGWLVNNRKPIHYPLFGIRAFGSIIYDPYEVAHSFDTTPESYFGKAFLTDSWIPNVSAFTNDLIKTIIKFCEAQDVYPVTENFNSAFYGFYNTLYIPLESVAKDSMLVTYYNETVDFLVRLHFAEDFDKAVADWEEHGFMGFIKGAYTIKTKSFKKGMFGFAGKGHELLGALMEAKANEKEEDMG